MQEHHQRCIVGAVSSPVLFSTCIISRDVSCRIISRDACRIALSRDVCRITRAPSSRAVPHRRVKEDVVHLAGHGKHPNAVGQQEGCRVQGHRRVGERPQAALERFARKSTLRA